MMKAKQLIKKIENYKAASFADFEVKGVSCNSKDILAGFIFVAVKGKERDGRMFIPQAAKAGARLVVAANASRRQAGFLRLPFVYVSDTRKALGQLSAAFYGYPSRRIKVVGITGTNGKTTLSYLLERILAECGIDSGVIGTVNYRFKNKVFPSKNTTPSSAQIQSMLAEMLERRVKYALLEVSSHALDQQRTEGISFHSAIFTNLSRDHLDYHRDMNDYFRAKAKLFKSLSRQAFCLLNNDSPYAKRLKYLSRASIVTYGIDKTASFMAKDIKLSVYGSDFTLVTGNKEYRISSRLIGRHNVYNILAAIAWSLKEGLPLAKVKSAIAGLPLIPGRMQKVPCAKGPAVFIDYAHSEDALENALTALRQITKGKLVVVFGCGGERDRGKRPDMGRVAVGLADLVVITSDNPRGESPLGIIKEIRSGIGKNNYLIEAQRSRAIKRAISISGPKDTVLIAGKGHEHYQIFKDKTVEFDDCKVARECLMSR